MVKNHKTVYESEMIPFRAWLTLFGLALSWGTSYILIKKGLIAFSPEQLASLRIGITALCFLPFFFLNFKKVRWDKWKQLFLVGFLGSFFPALLFSTAQIKISSSLSGVLSSLTPLFTLLIGVTFFKVKSSWRKNTGVALGFFGAVWLLVIDRGFGDLKGMAFGSFVIAACICYSISSNIVKSSLHDMSSLAISAVSYLMVGLPATLLLFTTDFIDIMGTHPQAWTSLGYISILAVSSTVLGSIFFFQLIKDTNVIFASTVSYLIPLVAILWGTLDGESTTLLHFIGMAIILLGVYISRK